jgi:hypothetical protein
MPGKLSSAVTLMAAAALLGGCATHHPKPPVSLGTRCTLGEPGWYVATLVDPEALRVASTFGNPETYEGSYWVRNPQGGWRWCVIVHNPAPGCRLDFQSITLLPVKGTFQSRGWVQDHGCLRAAPR